MRKYVHLLLIFIAIALAGCFPQVQATPTATPTANSRPAPTLVISVPSKATLSPASGCTVVTQKPTPGPTAAPIYPPITSADWVKGPAAAKVTIVEYSDFQ